MEQRTYGGTHLFCAPLMNIDPFLLVEICLDKDILFS